MLQALRSRLRRDHRWLRLRRLQQEGLLAARRRLQVWSRILATPPVSAELCQAGHDVELHLLCWDADYLSALWALKSFYRFVTEPLPLAVHFQGYMTPAVEGTLRSHLPGARLISQGEADRAVDEALSRQQLPRVAASRRQAPFMQKLVDFVVTAQTRRIMILDADVLFFSRPEEVFHALQSPQSIARFVQDPASCYNLSAEQAEGELGISLAPRINTGIVVIDRVIVDLKRCEYFLGNADVARPNGYIEQTLYALLASEKGCVSYWPDSYLISLDRGQDVDGLVARHYAGPSRPLMTSEGMRFLYQSDWLRSATGSA